jgi:uncharacterized membrane protein
MNLVYNHKSQKIEEINYLAKKSLFLYRLCQEICKFFKFFKITRANSSLILIFQIIKIDASLILKYF